MATDPQFAATPRLGHCRPGSAETDLQVPTNASDLLVAGASGSKIEEVLVVASTTGGLVSAVVNGLIYLFLHDGTTNFLFDEIAVLATTPSNTTAPYRTNRVYINLVLPSGWKIRASQSIAGNASLLDIFAHGADF